MRSAHPWVAVAALNGFVAVAFGAYATHGLAQDSHAQQLAGLASQYQLIHALALLASDRLAAENRRPATVASILFTLGMVLFSGSLYVKALTGSLSIPLVTPAGGVALLLGWFTLLLTGLTRRSV